MAKNYILEPIEVEFEDLGGQGIIGEIDSVINPTEYTKLVAALNSIERGHILLLGNIELQYASLMDDTNYLFTEDGAVPQSPPEHFMFIVPYSDYFVLKIMEPAGTYTISIYTGEDDPEPTPTDNPFSKNVVHNDHPYNAVERIRAKLKQKVEQGDSESSGSGEQGDSGSSRSGGSVFVGYGVYSEETDTTVYNFTGDDLIEIVDDPNQIFVYKEHADAPYIDHYLVRAHRVFEPGDTISDGMDALVEIHEFDFTHILFDNTELILFVANGEVKYELQEDIDYVNSGSGK